MKSCFLNTVGVEKRKEFLCGVKGVSCVSVWCSGSLELGLFPLNMLLAVPQCSLVIASLVISSLLPAFVVLAAISAHIDELCQCNVFQSFSAWYSKFSWPCM